MIQKEQKKSHALAAEREWREEFGRNGAFSSVLRKNQKHAVLAKEVKPLYLVPEEDLLDQIARRR